MGYRVGTTVFIAAVAVIAVSGSSVKRQSGPALPAVTHVQEASGTTAYDGESTHVLRVTYTVPLTPGGTLGTGVGNSTGSSGSSGSGSGGGETSTTSYTMAVDESAALSIHDDTSGVSGTSLTLVAPGSSWNIASGSATLNATVWSVPVSPGDQVTIRFRPNSTSYNTYFTIASQVIQTTVNNGVTTHTETDTLFWYITPSATSRNTATAVAVDSRKAFGQPNLQGALPGDPNAPASNVKFSGWTYNGGLFAGNSTFGTANDLSGTARIEVLGGSIQTGTVFQTVTLLALGLPATFNPSNSSAVQNATYPNLTGYIPATLGSTDLTNITWANAWDINGQSSTAIDFTPYASYSGPEFANFEFPGAGSQQYSIACSGESSIVTAGTNMWEYFADSSYLNALTAAGSSNTSSLPLSDGAPRVWTIMQSSVLSGSAWLTTTY